MANAIGPTLCLGKIGAPTRLNKRMTVSHSPAAPSSGEAELRNQVRSQAGAWEREGRGRAWERGHSWAGRARRILTTDYDYWLADHRQLYRQPSGHP